MEYLGLSKIQGGLVILEGVPDVAYDEIVTITQKDRELQRTGRVIQISGDTAIVLVFEGTEGLRLQDTVTRFSGRPMEISLSPNILGRVFDGLGRPRDGLGEIHSKTRRSIAGKATNPVFRQYPRNYIHTGFSAIDGLTTLIRGQKLPIFSADGLPHDRLAAQIASQANISDINDRNDRNVTTQLSIPKFAVVFAAMGASYDTAEFFKQSFAEGGSTEHSVMFLNLANDPPTERIATPRFALTAAEYLAYDLGYHVLVILTDMTAYAEALREISSARGEIPSRKGYPGYMYSDLASLYERAGILKGVNGSLTQIPILTMPNEDITHPIPDLTGYITEGQIVLDRSLHLKGIYPPINVLPSLSRLMKDGIGEGYTTPDHPILASKLFAKYAEVGDIRALATVIGESDLSPRDKSLIEFGRNFEETFIHQHAFENRSLNQTLSLARFLLQDST